MFLLYQYSITWNFFFEFRYKSLRELGSVDSVVYLFSHYFSPFTCNLQDWQNILLTKMSILRVIIEYCIKLYKRWSYIIVVTYNHIYAGNVNRYVRG